MSVIDIKTLSNDELKKKVAELVSVDYWSDKCGNCKRPALLHKEGPCKRQEKDPQMLLWGYGANLGGELSP